MDVIVHQFDGVSTLRAWPLAAGLLVASARRDPRLRDAARLSIETARLEPDAVVAAAGHPDVLAFSAYVWNERYSLEVARRARARFPGAFVLFGGPSVPRRPERAARFLREHPYVDALAFGEGEPVFREVLRALLDARPLAGVAGLALRAKAGTDGAVLTEPRERLREFDDTASPYLDGTFAALGGAPEAAIVETNRGCPFACTFCDWGQAIASQVRELPRARLSQELAWIARRGIPYLYIVDANYGIRRRDLEIAREVGRLKAATGFPRYVFFHLTKNATERHLDVVLALREAGIGTHLALSAQDFEPRVLEAVKRDNIRLDRALALRRICHERGIPTFNELILGLPEQTYDSFADSMAQAVTPFPLDAFNLYLARVLENAEMAAPEYRERYGIETRHVRMASFHHEAAPPVTEVEEIVVATRTMPVTDWRRAFKLGYLLAAAHNLRLLDVVIQVAWRAAGVERRPFLEALLARMAGAPPTSALRSIDAVLERYATAALAGEAMALPAAETGEHRWAVEDGVLLAAFVAGDRLFSELTAFVREDLAGADTALLGEAVRYQRLITPAPGDSAERRALFAYDFPAWRAQSGEAEGPVVAGRPTWLAWSPEPTLAEAGDLRAFLERYLALVHARRPTGRLSRRP